MQRSGIAMNHRGGDYTASSALSACQAWNPYQGLPDEMVASRLHLRGPSLGRMSYNQQYLSNGHVVSSVLNARRVST